MNHTDPARVDCSAPEEAEEGAFVLPSESGSVSESPRGWIKYVEEAYVACLKAGSQLRTGSSVGQAELVTECLNMVTTLMKRAVGELSPVQRDLWAPKLLHIAQVLWSLCV